MSTRSYDLGRNRLIVTRTFQIGDCLHRLIDIYGQNKIMLTIHLRNWPHPLIMTYPSWTEYLVVYIMRNSNFNIFTVPTLMIILSKWLLCLHSCFICS